MLQTSNLVQYFYLFFPALSVSGIHEVPGIKFKGWYNVGHVTLK